MDNHKILDVYLTDTHLKESNIDYVKAVFLQAMLFAKEQGLERVVHLGDNFHSRKSQPQYLFEVFEEILDNFRVNGIELWSITGNHDKTDYRKSKSFLSPFKHHPSFKLIEDTYYEQRDEVGIYYASYFDEDVYADKLLGIIESHQEEDQSISRKILRTHIGVNGAVMNNGTAIESEIDENLLSYFDNVHIGHYHDKQSFSNVDYIGASLQHNFGEEIEKGFVVCYSDGSLETIEAEDVPKFHNIEIAIEDLDQETIKELQFLQEEGIDVIKVVLTGSEEDLKGSVKADDLSKIGIKVATKTKKITKSDIEDNKWSKPETTEDLIAVFKEFCDEKGYKEEEGLIYLKKSLCIIQ